MLFEAVDLDLIISLSALPSCLHVRDGEANSKTREFLKEQCYNSERQKRQKGKKQERKERGSLSSLPPPLSSLSHSSSSSSPSSSFFPFWNTRSGCVSLYALVRAAMPGSFLARSP